MYEFTGSTVVLDEVLEERKRQERLLMAGKFLWTCASNEALRNKIASAVTEAEKYAVLGEEVGEVAREVVEEIIGNDRGDLTHAAESRSKLRKELIQVAAVCVAWVESLDKRGIK